MIAVPARSTPDCGLKGALGGDAKIERRGERHDEIKI